MIKIAICDDETTCLDSTKKMIGQWIENTGIPAKIDCFDNGDALLTKSRAYKFDIVFLDIVMPLLSGLGAARELRNTDKTVKIIFLTSSSEFAFDSYSVKAKDYLLKPVTYEKMKEVLDDCSIELKQEPDHIILKTSFGYQKIYLHDIEYIEAQNKQCVFFLTSGKSFKTAEPLYTFEDKLLSELGFFKCHRSYIVSIPNIDNFNSTEIRTKQGFRLPIARGLGKTFSEAYFAFMFRD